MLLLRSLCKLTHKGHKQYAKGDGHQFCDFMTKKWNDVADRCVGRAEHSKRQDWIIQYTVSNITLGANILRDSMLTRLENMHYEAYVHVNVIMWKVSALEPYLSLVTA